MKNINIQHCTCTKFTLYLELSQFTVDDFHRY